MLWDSGPANPRIAQPLARNDERAYLRLCICFFFLLMSWLRTGFCLWRSGLVGGNCTGNGFSCELFSRRNGISYLNRNPTLALRMFTCFLFDVCFPTLHVVHTYIEYTIGRQKRWRVLPGMGPKLSINFFPLIAAFSDQQTLSVTEIPLYLPGKSAISLSILSNRFS